VRPVAQTCAHARKRLPVCGGTALACRRAGPAPYARLRLAARPLREFLALGLPLSILDRSLQCSAPRALRRRLTGPTGGAPVRRIGAPVRRITDQNKARFGAVALAARRRTDANGDMVYYAMRQSAHGVTQSSTLGGLT
jgi:hypothetical protein